MRIIRIGDIQITGTTWSVETTALEYEPAGVGFTMTQLYQPRPLRVTLLVRRGLIDLVRERIDQLAYTLVKYERVRIHNKDYAPGVPIRIQVNLNDTAITRLINTEMRIVSIERVSDGWMGRVEVSGLMLHPPIAETELTQTVSRTLYTPDVLMSLYEQQVITYNIAVVNTIAISDMFLAVDTPSTPITMLPFSEIVSGAGVYETVVTGVQRWRVTSGTSAVVRYTIAIPTPSVCILPIYVPPSIPQTATMTITSRLHRSVTYPISPGTSFYRLLVYDCSITYDKLSVSLSNISANLALYPILAVPLEAHTYYARCESETTRGEIAISTWRYDTFFGYHREFNGNILAVSGTVYGAQGAVVTSDARLFIAATSSSAALPPLDTTVVTHTIYPHAFA